MKKFIVALGLSLIGTIANAEEPLFDLNEMPEGYSFVSEGGGRKIAVTYLGRSGDMFTFRFHRDYVDGRNEIEVILANQESQYVSSMGGSGTAYASPHGCFPSVGECTYSYRSDRATYSGRVSTEDVGGIWVAERFIQLTANGEWIYLEKVCIIYDDYGFWLDELTVAADGTSDFQLRTNPPVEGDPEDRLQRLRTACGVDEVPLV